MIRGALAAAALWGELAAGEAIAQQPGSAFRDSAARVLWHRARDARMRQDSALVSYDAIAHERISAGATVGRIARERLLLRRETATRVRWHRDAGAHAEVIGARTMYPGASLDDANRKMLGSIPQTTALPFYPRQETFWIENGLELDEARLVHPLAENAENFYAYQTGDSVELRLPDGSEIRLRELKVRPRAVAWNVIVGSLWFDVDRGLLVRAAYRLAEPLDVWARAADDSANDAQIPRIIRGIVRPMHAQITAMVVEYGLHQGRFWLPRIRTVKGHLQATFLRVTFSIENSYRYSAVNTRELDSLPAVVLSEAVIPSAASNLQSQPCDTGTAYTLVQTRTKARIPVATTISCDHRALAQSTEFSGNIFGRSGDFDDDASEELSAEALGLGAQPEWGWRRPDLEYGLPLTRFNRIEGLSIGLRATQQLGAGFAGDATLRFGFADRDPTLELGLARTNLDRTIRVGGYSRLASAGDWGNPLSLGSSLSALLWGRDDGFYYRARGMDLTASRERGAPLSWRFFVEEQLSAVSRNTFSVAKLVRDIAFQPNVIADRGTWAGGSVRAARTVGLDPRAWRAFGDLRLEGAARRRGSSYGRAAFDATLSRALGRVVSDAPVAAFTVSAGSSVGRLPPQRFWFLGGVHTVRGQPAGASSGDAYWFGRVELAQDALRIGRISLFGDAGWAGPRASYRGGERLSGAGVGFSMLDGLVRVDVAKGLHPRTGLRPNLYLEARF